MSSDKKALARLFVEAINAGDHDALDDIMAPDVTRHCQATPEVEVRSLEEFKAFDLASRATFPDQHLELAKVISEGDYVAAWLRYRGTQKGPMGPFPASDKAVDLDFSGWFRFENGKIAEMWVTWDNVTLLRQLGHLVRAR